MRRYHIVLIVIAIFVIVFFAFGYIPARASLLYGPPARSLSIADRIDYSRRLLSHGQLLTTPFNLNGIERPFHIDQGEPIASIATRLQQSGIIVDAQVLSDYLVYTGLDITLQAGDYRLSSALSIVDIAHKLQDFSPSDATLVILPGWRMEEIAASLRTSGLDISPQAFLAAAQTPPQVLATSAGLSAGLDSPATMEGFFLPDSYTLPRSTTVDQLLETIARNFALHITDDLRAGFSAHSLNLHQAVTLASIVERESVHNEEMPAIAAVFLNRLKSRMALGSDPTVQYALGYNSIAQTWWTNPLSLTDLKIDSPYNTYVYLGLPPGPIASPGLDALRAVAFPEDSPYYYFQAKCDNSGYHIFAQTLDEQIANGCQ